MDLRIPLTASSSGKYLLPEVKDRILAAWLKPLATGIRREYCGAVTWLFVDKLIDGGNHLRQGWPEPRRISITP